MLQMVFADRFGLPLPINNVRNLLAGRSDQVRLASGLCSYWNHRCTTNNINRIDFAE